MMRTLYNMRLAMIAVTVLGVRVPIARGQQQGTDQPAQPAQAPQSAQPAQPIPAYHSPLAGAADNGAADDANADPQKLLPDTSSLTGVQDFTLGAPAATHSFWQPHFDLYGTIDSDPLNPTGTNGLTTFTSVFGGVDLHRNSGNSTLTLTYIGGGSFSNDGESSNGVIQGLNFSERLTYRRYAISFFDSLLYAPLTSFGAAGIPGVPTLPGNGGTYVPGQSLLTSRGQRLTNSSNAELDVFLTSRSSLTFVGGYSLLDNFDDSTLNYGNVIFSAGYNYQISRANTVGTSYQFSSFDYPNFNQSIKNNFFLLSFGRRITGRLALQVSGGPDVAFVNIPISTAQGTTGGTEGGTSAPSTSSTQVYGSFNGSLLYQLRRVGLQASYIRGVTAGSGVLAGAVTDTVTGSVNSQISRTISLRGNVGYSRNRGLAVNGMETANQTYNYWFTGFTLDHPLGKSMTLYLAYQLQYQTSNASICAPGSVCQASLTRNTVTFGFSWRKQPIPF